MKVSENSFENGQIFGYWPEWKEDESWIRDIEKRQLMNECTRAQLHITPVYKGIKEEAFESGFMNVRGWRKHLIKLQEYMRTVRVKSIESVGRHMKIGILSIAIGQKHYGIEEKAPICLNQLLGIILYCDSTALQADFSSTFRQKYQFESIEELKKKHRKYFHFAKAVVESVIFYGINHSESGELENGPLYCGLNCVLTMGQFAAFFKAPTSFTKDIEVAINGK